MSRTIAAALLAAVLLIGASSPTRAADCEVVPHTLDEVQHAVHAGSALREALDATAAEVAFVGRIGSDQSKRGILYTHAGLAWRDHPEGRWHFIHLLNHCGSDASELFDDGPVDFFLERPFRYEALVVVPTPELRRALVRRLREGASRRLHEPRYSAIAHPLKTRFQNSNQWLLELVAVALEPEAPLTRDAAQRILRRWQFEPERVRLGFFERVGTHRMGNVSLKDHSRGELRRGGFVYVSVKSLRRFLEDNGLAEQVFELPCEPCRQTSLTTTR
ncbi:MAG: DUF2145 domain-containing protein [Acidobacteriota bacterium]